MILISSTDGSVQRHLQSALSSFEMSQSKSLTATIERLNVEKPDVLLVDNELVWEAGVIEQLNEASTQTKVIILSSHPSEEEGLTVIQAGASGYCNSFTSPELLAKIVETVLAGDIWVGRNLMLHLIKMSSLNQRKKESVRKCDLNDLTEREKEVALQVSKGESNKRIAMNLGITERTVKAHLTTVFNKLQLKDRLQLAIIQN